MANNVNTGVTTIPYGATLRIGYRTYGSSSAYTYLTYFPSYNELPYTFTLPVGVWEVEYTTICPSCSTPTYSSAQTVVVTVTSG